MKSRNTVQNRLVIEAIKILKNHPTVDEIHQEILKKYSDISLATVYRNLKKLTDSKEVLRISLPNEADRYDHNTKNHYHIKCNQCGKFFDLECEYLWGFDEYFKSNTSFVIESHQIIFKGICPSCNSKNK